MGAVMGTAGFMGFALTPFVDFPDPAAWGYLATSIAIHQVYYISVCLGYRFGDLSQVYPIQRGIAPLLVAIGSFVFAGEVLNTQGMIAVCLISLAILSLAIGSNMRFTGGRAVPIALCTGVLIAAYTITDGLGGRLSGDVLGYIVWLQALEGIPFTILLIWMLKREPLRVSKRHLLTGAAGGVLSFFAYGLVIWAMSISQMTYVSALRETSVILAALIGSRMLAEPFGRHRIIAASLVAIGVFMLQVSNAV